MVEQIPRLTNSVQVSNLTNGPVQIGIPINASAYGRTTTIQAYQTINVDIDFFLFGLEYFKDAKSKGLIWYDDAAVNPGGGSMGATGVQGPQGIPGATGSQGPQGATGIAGVGFTGMSGPQGATGLQGYTGVGLQGTTGVGSPGLTGATGVQGITGIRGATGAGIQGTTGLQGIGLQGTTGVQGVTGPGGGTGTGSEIQVLSFDSGLTKVTAFGTATDLAAITATRVGQTITFSKPIDVIWLSSSIHFTAAEMTTATVNFVFPETSNETDPTKMVRPTVIRYNAAFAQAAAVSSFSNTGATITLTVGGAPAGAPAWYQIIWG